VEQVSRHQPIARFSFGVCRVERRHSVMDSVHARSNRRWRRFTKGTEEAAETHIDSEQVVSMTMSLAV
jgi:hypothetical protein